MLIIQLQKILTYFAQLHYYWNNARNRTTCVCMHMFGKYSRGWLFQSHPGLVQLCLEWGVLLEQTVIYRRSMCVITIIACGWIELYYKMVSALL